MSSKLLASQGSEPSHVRGAMIAIACELSPDVIAGASADELVLLFLCDSRGVRLGKGCASKGATVEALRVPRDLKHGRGSIVDAIVSDCCTSDRRGARRTLARAAGTVPVVAIFGGVTVHLVPRLMSMGGAA